MANSSNSSSGGIGFVGLLQVLFIGLKLAGVGTIATWSWFWVLSPIWITILVILAVCALVMIGMLIKEFSK